MLTSKDLMIGDWYAFRGHPYKCTASDIASIAECEENGAPTDISEIPLTAEILEKNGFTRPNERVRYFTESTDYYDVDIHEITDSIWCFEYQNCEAHFPPCLILIAHVHELQHALRLCGIEKEITL